MSNKKNFKILIVEDEEKYAEGLQRILELEGFKAHTVSSAEEAWDIIKQNSYNLVLTDLMLGGMDGIELLKLIHKEKYPPYVIMMTAYATVSNAVAAMKSGAVSYFVKGNSPELLLDEIQKIYELCLEKSYNIENDDVIIKTENSYFQKIIDSAIKVAQTPVNILLLGETGVGKEVFARMIHQVSKRSNKQFIAVNCQAFSETVLESELFGHRKGAFTGANEDRVGRFEAADQGTLFLDEIGDLSLSVQVKLLRVIETRSIERMGCNINRPIDFRLITATNKSVQEMVREGTFREDLYYRINTVEITIPPLRERKEDIPELAHYFVHQASERMGKKIHHIAPEVWLSLSQYNYPGNVRELKNIMERLVVFSENGVINNQHLFMMNLQNGANDGDGDTDQTLKSFRNTMEKQFIASTLKKNDYNVTHTAESLGITRRQLQNKINELEIEKL